MITSTMIEALNSRAKMLSNKYYFLEKEDLFHDGMEFLLKLSKTKKEEKVIFKSINNYFCNIQDRANIRASIEKNSSSFEIEPDVEILLESPEETIHKKQVTKKLLDSLLTREKIILEMLSQGANLDQISNCLHLSRNNIHRIIRKLVYRREKLDAAS